MLHPSVFFNCDLGFKKEQFQKLHKDQLVAYQAMAKRAVFEFGKTVVLPGGNGDSAHIEKCVEVAVDTAPGWKLTRAVIQTILQSVIPQRIGRSPSPLPQATTPTKLITSNSEKKSDEEVPQAKSTTVQETKDPPKSVLPKHPEQGNSSEPNATATGTRDEEMEEGQETENHNDEQEEGEDEEEEEDEEEGRLARLQNLNQMTRVYRRRNKPCWREINLLRKPPSRQFTKNL